MREITQASTSFKNYVLSFENVLEILILVGYIGYQISLLKCPLASIHFGAWTVIFSWFEMTLLLGRFPSIGIYIYMSTNVFITLSIFLMVYSPVLIAFATAFYILLPWGHSKIFKNFILENCIGNK